MANPDGYDFTFEPGQRLWRKNLRDNDGDGQITAGDGVDLNRNFPYKWGYDNEGSSPNPASETYRGPSRPPSPRPRRSTRFVAAGRLEFLVNYHSAAELLLYGTGWQVATPSPDDAIYEAMAGDDEDPAVPGYDPDISAELYTTNGDTDSHLHRALRHPRLHPRDVDLRGRLRVDPDDEWEAEDCGSGFEFPDDEGAGPGGVREEHPVRAVDRRVGGRPGRPGVRGRAHGGLPPRQLRRLVRRPADRRRHRQAGAADACSCATASTAGGSARSARQVARRRAVRRRERRLLRRVPRRGARRRAPATACEVWFTGRSGAARAAPARVEPFTYEVASDTGADVLVIANEDYTGVNPTYPAGTTAPKYARPT